MLHDSAARHNVAWIQPSFGRCDEGSYGQRQQLVNRTRSLLRAVANRIFRLNENFEMLHISKLICSRRIPLCGEFAGGFQHFHHQTQSLPAFGAAQRAQQGQYASGFHV